jgi:hypothetical protein
MTFLEHVTPHLHMPRALCEVIQSVQAAMEGSGAALGGASPTSESYLHLITDVLGLEASAYDGAHLGRASAAGADEQHLGVEDFGQLLETAAAAAAATAAAAAAAAAAEAAHPQPPPQGDTAPHQAPLGNSVASIDEAESQQIVDCVCALDAADQMTATQLLCDTVCKLRSPLFCKGTYTAAILEVVAPALVQTYVHFAKFVFNDCYAAFTLDPQYVKRPLSVQRNSRVAGGGISSTVPLHDHWSWGDSSIRVIARPNLQTIQIQ